MTPQPHAFSPPLPWDQFCTRFLSLYRPPLRAPNTGSVLRRALDDFRRATDARTVADLTTEAVAAFVATRAGLNANTTRSKVRALRVAANHAVAEGWLDRAPAWRRCLPRAAPPRKRKHLDFEEVATLLDHLRARAVDWPGRRLHALTATVAFTGLRKMEALCLEVEDVDLARGVLWVSPRRRLKTEASAAPVPIPAELAETLAGWLPECGGRWVFPGNRRRGPWTGGSREHNALGTLRAAGREAGVPDVGFHALRHTLAKLMVHRFGLSADQARSVLRHSSTATTEAHYLHRDDLACLRQIAAAIRFRAA